MKKKIIVFVLLIISYECNGGLLKGLFDSALQVHKDIHGVASSILFGVNPEKSNKKETEKPNETIIVIVNDHTRPQNQNGQHNYNTQENYLDNNGNGNNNNPNNFGQHNPPNYVNNNNGPPQGNHGQYNRPGYGNNNNLNNAPNYGQNPSVPNQNINAFPNPNDANKVQYTTTQKVVEDKKTEKDDEPLFVPLNPNEYIYNGDKIHVESPKRETEDKSKAGYADDEDIPIDIRFKDD